MDDAPNPRSAATRTVKIIDGTTLLLVDAVLRTCLDASDFTRIEDSWADARRSASESFSSKGRSIEHGHWDWRLKSPWFERGQLAGVLLECDGIPQGVLAHRTNSSRARLAANQNVSCLYVEFIEVAPWNTRTLVSQSRYKSIGTLLMREAVSLSRERGWGGRVSLHSLPQAEAFYLSLGMTPFGPDSQYNDLAYFEFREEDADVFVRLGRRSS